MSIFDTVYNILRAGLKGMDTILPISEVINEFMRKNDVSEDELEQIRQAYQTAKEQLLEMQSSQPVGNPYGSNYQRQKANAEIMIRGKAEEVNNLVRKYQEKAAKAEPFDLTREVDKFFTQR